MKNKRKVSPLAERIADYADVELDEIDDYEFVQNNKINDWASELSQVPINHKADKCLSAASWFHEMQIHGMSKEEERYVELMLIEMAEFYFADFHHRRPSRKCQEALDAIRRAIEEKSCSGS